MGRLAWWSLVGRLLDLRNRVAEGTGVAAVDDEEAHDDDGEHHNERDLESRVQGENFRGWITIWRSPANAEPYSNRGQALGTRASAEDMMVARGSAETLKRGTAGVRREQRPVSQLRDSGGSWN